ncbi:MAG: DUF2442 domain-containing protein [Flavobacteriaceae bacterium]|jgi:hypothetical protein|nr:DUF2442 domain-containing protein [Flavobacteriaceae bacterium]
MRKQISFDEDYIYLTENGETKSQSLFYYPKLKLATDEERGDFELNAYGIYWEKLDEDVSFESFDYEDEFAETSITNIFKKFPEINVNQLAKRLSINQSLLAKYACGDKTPSETRRKEIERGLHLLGNELMSVSI